VALTSFCHLEKEQRGRASLV